MTQEGIFENFISFEESVKHFKIGICIHACGLYYVLFYYYYHFYC